MVNQNVDRFPSSSQQQRLHDLGYLGKNGNVLLFYAPKEISKNEFEHKIAHILSNVESLYTVFGNVSLSKYPLQEVTDTLQVQVNYHDCSAEKEAKDLIALRKKVAFHTMDQASIRFDIYNWKGERQLVLVTASMFFSDYHSLILLFTWFLEETLVSNDDDESIQYIDYSEWQRSLLKEKDGEEYSYWEKTINSLEKTNRFSSDLEIIRTHQAQFKTTDNIKIPSKIKEGLTKLLKKEDFDLESIFLAAWWKLLKNYYTNAFTLAYKHVGRSDTQTEQVFGLFEKYLPIVFEEDMIDASISDLAKKTKQIQEFQEGYQEYFFNEINKKNGQLKFFPLQFAFYELPKQENTAYQLEYITSSLEDYGLKLNIIKSSTQELTTQIHYNSLFISDKLACCLQEAFFQLLDLELIKAEAGINAWNNQKQQLALNFQQNINPEIQLEVSAETLIDKLERSFDQHQKRIAITYQDRVLNYKELDDLTNQLAHFIIKKTKGIKQSIIAVQLANPLDMVVSFIAILKSGNAFLPIDIKNPQDRTAYMLSQSGAVFFIHDQKEQANSWSIEACDWLTIEYTLASCPKESVKHELAPDAPCFLIYTSGTSGLPKGVLIAQKAIVNYLDSYQQHFEITEADSTILFSSMAFDLGHTSIWSSLLSGANLHLINQAESLDFLKNINLYLAKHKISYFKCTPSHFKIILDDPNFAKFAPQQKIRHILLGGEQINADDLKKYLSYHKNTQLVNEYGPTETTIGVTLFPVTAHNVDAFSNLPLIGPPVANHHIYILDKDKQPTLPGAFGELYIGGAGLALGYLNLPKRTKKSFVKLPFETACTNLFYATGDLGRWLPDGNLQLGGRIDNQVKVRGYRIELEGISQVILNFKAVQSAFTMLKTSQKGDTLLRSFLVFRDKDATIAQLESYLKEQLPDYMIPDQLFEVEEIPLNSNGKTDLERLNDLATKIVASSDRVLPNTELEKEIATIWRSLLEIDSIGIHQNFFKHGGYSILAMKMLSQLQKKLTIKVSIADFFQHPTIHYLAQRVEAAQKQSTTLDGFKSIERVNEDTLYYDLSYAQLGLWIENQLKGAAETYIGASVFEVQGNLDVTHLERSMQILLHRHEILRTNFIKVKGTVKQKINPPTLCFPVVKQIDPMDSVQDLEQFIAKKSIQEFDLEKDQLFKCYLSKKSDQQYFLILLFHHIITDLWSEDLLAREMKILLSSPNAPEEIALPELAIRFVDYAAWEKTYLSGENLDRMRSFFATQFSDALPVLKLRPDFVPHEHQKKTCATSSFKFDRKLTLAILEACKENQSTLNAFFITVVKTLLFRLTNQEDIIIGTPVANRLHPDTEGIFGCFFNLVPYRSRFKRTDRFLDLLDRLNKQFNSSLDYISYPIDFLIADFNIPRVKGKTPLFNVLCESRFITKHEASKTEIHDLKIQHVPIPTKFIQYDLRFLFTTESEELSLTIEYNSSLFKETTIQQYYELIQSIFNSFLENPQIKLNEIGAAPADTSQLKSDLEAHFNF